MSSRIDLTLRELAQIALGGPTITNSNLLILQSLLEIILKKLNCKDEIVTVSGLDAKCLRQILEIATVSPMALNSENVKIVTKELENIDNLKVRMINLDTKLENHFKDVERQGPLEVNPIKCKQFSAQCADLCTLCDPDNDIACKLLTNCEFMTHLTATIGPPIVTRVLAVENKIKHLRNEFTFFMKRIVQEYNKVARIEHCIYEISELRKKISFYHSKFLATMEELQDLIDAKMDRVHFPPLKQYIKEQFAELNAEIEKMRAEKECPQAAGTIFCNSLHIPCEQAKDEEDEEEELKKKLPKKYCGCADICKPEEIEALKNPKPKKTVKMCSLKKDFNPLQLFEGTDGSLYRKG